MRLGAYNGLHVALRARRDGIPAVVIGKPDMVLERDARQLGATFITSGELERERILAVVQALIAAEMAGIPALSRGEEEQQVGVPEVLPAMLSDRGRPDYKSH